MLFSSLMIKGVFFVLFKVTFNEYVFLNDLFFEPVVFLADFEETILISFKLLNKFSL